MPTTPGDEPAVQAHGLVERLFALLHDCRTVSPQLEAARTDPESKVTSDLTSFGDCRIADGDRITIDLQGHLSRVGRCRGKSLRGPEGITG